MRKHTHTHTQVLQRPSRGCNKTFTGFTDNSLANSAMNTVGPSQHQKHQNSSLLLALNKHLTQTSANSFTSASELAEKQNPFPLIVTLTGMLSHTNPVIGSYRGVQYTYKGIFVCCKKVAAELSIYKQCLYRVVLY